MQLWQALVLGVLQGVAELFPISSLAQTILLPALLKWDIDQANTDFLAFVVALHLATAVALVLFFRKDWIQVLRGFLGFFTHGKLVYNAESKFAWLLVVGTVIVGAAGLALEKHLRAFFDKPAMAWIVALILVVNGFIMLLGDYLKRKTKPEETLVGPDHASDLVMHAALVGQPVKPNAGTGETHQKTAEDLTFFQALWVGASQTFALLPGISRSGVTIVSGLWAGLSYEESSRFTFMLATPVIAAAALKKVPDLLHQDHQTIMLAVYGSIAAFVAAYLSVKFLMRYFHTNRLWPFGIFCIIVGTASAFYLKPHTQNNLAEQVGVHGGSEVVQQNAPTSR